MIKNRFHYNKNNILYTTFEIYILETINCISKKFCCFSCFAGFDSSEELLNHAKHKHAAFWVSARAATVLDNRDEALRQEGRDQVRNDLHPELEEVIQLRRQVQYCLAHHDALPPMPQLIPRPERD